jgi:hypothetical protein
MCQGVLGRKSWGAKGGFADIDVLVPQLRPLLVISARYLLCLYVSMNTWGWKGKSFQVLNGSVSAGWLWVLLCLGTLEALPVLSRQALCVDLILASPTTQLRPSAGRS